jgi:hypothetical protein
MRNRTHLLDLLCMTRVADMTVSSRALVLGEFMTCQSVTRPSAGHGHGSLIARCCAGYVHDSLVTRERRAF